MVEMATGLYFWVQIVEHLIFIRKISYNIDPHLKLVITNLEDPQSTQKSFYSLIAKDFGGMIQVELKDPANGLTVSALSPPLVIGLLWVQFCLPPYNLHSMPRKKKTGIKGFNLNQLECSNMLFVLGCFITLLLVLESNMFSVQMVGWLVQLVVYDQCSWSVCVSFQCILRGSLWLSINLICVCFMILKSS